MKYINTKLQSRKRRFETDSIISDNCSSVEFEVVRPTLVNSESQKHLQMLVNDSQRKVSPQERKYFHDMRYLRNN